jgi:hypothetical protein
MYEEKGETDDGFVFSKSQIPRRRMTRAGLVARASDCSAGFSRRLGLLAGSSSGN